MECWIDRLGKSSFAVGWLARNYMSRAQVFGNQWMEESRDLWGLWGCHEAEGVNYGTKGLTVFFGWDVVSHLVVFRWP